MLKFLDVAAPILRNIEKMEDFRRALETTKLGYGPVVISTVPGDSSHPVPVDTPLKNELSFLNAEELIPMSVLEAIYKKRRRTRIEFSDSFDSQY